MRHFSRTSFGICIIVIAALFAWVIMGSLRSKEPEYQGRPLSAWADDMTVERQNLFESELQAGEIERLQTFTNVVRSVGTNGLPHYLAWLEHAPRQASRVERFRDWLAEISGSRVRLPEGHDRTHQAVLAIQILGPNANPAITRLKRLLNNESACGAAGRSLAAIGGDAVPVLVATLTNASSERVRLSAAQALGDLGQSAKPARAVLLGQIGKEQPRILPGITTADLILRAVAEMEPISEELAPLWTAHLFATNAAIGAAYGLARADTLGIVPLLIALTNENAVIRCAAEAGFELREFLRTERGAVSLAFDHFNATFNNRLLQATIRPFADAERRTIERAASAQTNNADMSVRLAASNVLDHFGTFSRTNAPR